MGGSVSTMVSDATDAELIDGMDAVGYREETKELLVENVRKADKALTIAKNNYGNGVSVKGILVNISGSHFVSVVKKETETGKSWSDPETVAPTSADNLDCSYFFHAKSSDLDAAAKGCRGGFVLDVTDARSVKGGVISVAWENPHNGDFVSCVKVSKTHDLLQDCLIHCNNSDTSEISGHVDLPAGMRGDRIKKYISVTVKKSRSTAYILIAAKVYNIVRQIYGEM